MQFPEGIGPRHYLANFEQLCHSLGEHGLNAAELLYVQVEGEPFLDGREPSERMETWATPYKELLTGYRDDAEGRTLTSYDILLNAFKPRRRVPAIITYDMNQLRAITRPPQMGRWWVHKSGGSITPALNSLTYLK